MLMLLSITDKYVPKEREVVREVIEPVINKLVVDVFSETNSI